MYDVIRTLTYEIDERVKQSFLSIFGEKIMRQQTRKIIFYRLIINTTKILLPLSENMVYI